MDEHSITVQVEYEDGVTTYTAVQAMTYDFWYTDDKTGPIDLTGGWSLPQITLTSPDDIWGLRLLLDEIEKRVDG